VHTLISGRNQAGTVSVPCYSLLHLCIDGLQISRHIRTANITAPTKSSANDTDKWCGSQAR